MNLGRWPKLGVAGARAAAEAVKKRARTNDTTPDGATLGQLLTRYRAERLAELKAVAQAGLAIGKAAKATVEALYEQLEQIAG